jgi:predicted phage-related endonuclease
MNRKIGGTSIAAVVCKHPYKSRFDLYHELIGDMPETPDNVKMERGRRFESPLLETFLHCGAVTPDTGKSNIVIQHPQHDYIAGTPDFIADNADYGVEVKTASYETLYTEYCEFGNDKDTFVPFHYYCQCQLYAGLTNKAVWWLYVAFLENDQRGFDKIRDTRIYRIDFKPELYNAMIQKCVEFYETFVENRLEPPLDMVTETTKRYINHRFPPKEIEDTPVEADEYAERLASQLVAARTRRVEQEQQEEILKAQLQMALGEHTVLMLANGKKITYRPDKNGRRILRV